MRVSRIFTEAPLKPRQQVVLEEKTSHYLKTVLRLTPGSKLILFNGDGNEYQAVIKTLDKKSITADILTYECLNNESPLSIHLGIAISKGDRMDLVMQKATELGVTEITPLISERTEVKLKAERLGKKLKHWRQILISACEQCGRNQIPQLHTLQTIDNWAAAVKADKKFVLHHRTTTGLNTTESITSTALLIGPEGGLSEQEIIQAQSHRFTELSLGPRILRTETAPLAAIAVLQYCWGDY